jgi:sodium transport system permease protein
MVYFGFAVLIPLLLHAPMLALVQLVIEQFPSIEHHLKQLEKHFDLKAPLGVQLLVLAVLPAICEELAFRGFILTGLSRRLGTGNAILGSSLLFAFAHLDAFRFFHTFILGVILGILATRSGSLLPCMLFHGVHNGLSVCMGHVQLSPDQNELLYDQLVPFLAAATVIMVFLLWRMPVRRVPIEDQTEGTP